VKEHDGEIEGGRKKKKKKQHCEKKRRNVCDGIEDKE
jgi:hypothetical protein